MPASCAPMFILSMSLISKAFAPDSIFGRDWPNSRFYNNSHPHAMFPTFFLRGAHKYRAVAAGACRSRPGFAWLVWAGATSANRKLFHRNRLFSNSWVELPERKALRQVSFRVAYCSASIRLKERGGDARSRLDEQATT